MFDKWLKLPAHYYLHIIALSLLIVGVSLSNVLMSIGTIWIIANSLIELNFRAKWKRLKSNKTLIAICLFFGFMIFTLAWSEDLNYASKDLLIKLPLITVPLVVGTSKPLENKIYRFLLYLFVGTLSFTTLFNYIRFNTNNFIDIREMSFFISHIRLGTLLCLAIFLIGYENIKNKMKFWFTAPLLLWFVYYLYKSQTLTAYVLILLLSVISLFYLIKESKIKYILAFTILSLSIFAGLYVKKNITTPNLPEDINYDELVFYTPNGNGYHHDTSSTLSENGNLVWMYVCLKECEIEWNKRSLISFDSTDRKGQPIYGSLMRYMTSMDLHKDSVGFLSLNTEDILNIENGHTSINFNRGIKGKINELYLEYYTYSSDGDPNGHSFIQRIEHFKAALNLVKSNWLFGVGIGDVQSAFETQYIADHSKLNSENRHKSHNQFLTVWISTGILGLGLLIFILFTPLFEKKIEFSVLIVSVSLIFAFFTQDMIETQAGVTIFAVFYSLINYKEKYGSKVR